MEELTSSWLDPILLLAPTEQELCANARFYYQHASMDALSTGARDKENGGGGHVFVCVRGGVTMVGADTILLVRWHRWLIPAVRHLAWPPAEW